MNSIIGAVGARAEREGGGERERENGAKAATMTKAANREMQFSKINIPKLCHPAPPHPPPHPKKKGSLVPFVPRTIHNLSFGQDRSSPRL